MATAILKRRGRPANITSIVEEARVNDYALAHELRIHDQWEIAALETLAITLAQPVVDIPACQAIVAKLRQRDLRENRLHAEITDVWESAGA